MNDAYWSGATVDDGLVLNISVSGPEKRYCSYTLIERGAIKWNLNSSKPLQGLRTERPRGRPTETYYSEMHEEYIEYQTEIVQHTNMATTWNELLYHRNSSHLNKRYVK